MGGKREAGRGGRGGGGLQELNDKSRTVTDSGVWERPRDGVGNPTVSSSPVPTESLDHGTQVTEINLRAQLIRPEFLSVELIVGERRKWKGET